MPLKQEQEDLEHELRVDQMTVNVEKMRADLKWESRKFAMQLAATIAVSIGATLAVVNYFTPKSVAPQIIYVPTIPAPSVK